ncbi:DUF1684 domain-containing protein [Streptomyces sp. NPDC058872]|uniref:DUF1684 domain-containing protein n=1 Tax=Streptomyces sp. NPDC058872 TaxID=3346661 RepID=UPI0036A8B43F
MVRGDGVRRTVFADATGGRDGHRFRFLRPEVRPADGSVRGHFKRAPLPPCVFAGRSTRPFLSSGNTFDRAVVAGGRRW